MKLFMRAGVFIAYLFFALSVHAQLNQVKQFLPNPVPKSPEASSLFKFSSIPVNHFTGVPEISIPIYEISIGDIVIPISVSYHAGGIKVAERSGWVGLGWSLNTGATISRRIMGLPDETGSGNGYFTGPTVKVRAENNENTDAWLDYLWSISQGQKDGEPDIFNYSLDGKNGTFIFNQRDNYKTLITPYEPIKITKRGQPNLYFDIVNENGVTYKFDITEVTNSQNGGSSVIAPSSWPVTEIISSNQQDKVQYFYTQANNINMQGEYYNFLTVSDNVADFNETYVYSSDYGTLGQNFVTSSVNLQKLSEIKFRTGKIVFEKQPVQREDLYPDYALKSISVMSLDPVNNTYKLIKKVVFYQSYFIEGSDAATKRLRLDAIEFQAGSGQVAEKYQFQYNSLPLPKYESTKIDYWGYYNGKNNDNLIPRMSIPYQLNASAPTTSITIGSQIVNGRDPDPNFNQACQLKRVYYPTGGFTDFTFETNSYVDDIDGLTKFAGGLRIKQTKSYTDATSTPIIKTYSYSPGQEFFRLGDYLFQTTQTNRAWTGTQQAGTKRVRTFLPNPSLGMENANGNSVGYPNVIEYDGDATTNNGKTEYTYNSAPDGLPTLVPAINKPEKYIYVDRGQLLFKRVSKRNANGTYNKVSELENLYGAFTQTWSANVGFVAAKVNVNDNPGNNAKCPLGPAAGCADYSYNYTATNFDFRSADAKIKYSANTIFDPTDESKFQKSETFYSYENFSHQQVTKTQTINSKNESIWQYNKYPHDYATTPYIQMVTNNSINKLVEQKTYNETVFLSSAKTNYADKSNGNLVPSTVDIQVNTQPLETRAYLDQYDKWGNILQFRKTSDVIQSCIWDYNSAYMVANVTNAALTDIAYTSFEADGKGNWTFIGTVVADLTAPTGKKAYNLTTGGLSRTITAANTYIISYWRPTASSALTITGTAAGYPITGRTVNGWKYYEHKITGVSSAQLTGTGLIDELRLYPEDAQMATYTHEPLIGMSSQCDANNRISYFEYNNSQRLVLIRDQDRNIVKKICYNYAGQPENCQLYVSDNKSGTYTRNDCSSGYTAGSVYVNIPAGSFTSSESLTEANQKAMAYGQQQANATGTCTAPCFFDMADGRTHITSGLFPSGSIVDFYLIFTSNSPMTSNGTTKPIYDIAIIEGACKPSETRTITITENNRTWEVSIYPNGAMTAKIMTPNVTISSGATINFDSLYSL